MSARPKVFAIGTLSTSQVSLCKVPQGKLWIVRGAVFHVTGGTARDVSVFLRRSTTSRRIGFNALAIGGNVTFEEGWVLEEGDTLEALQAVGSDVTFYVYGVEEDA